LGIGVLGYIGIV